MKNRAFPLLFSTDAPQGKPREVYSLVHEQGESAAVRCKKQNGECSKRGFTLVELSMVLIIIGMIAASVLVGSTLIHQAQLRKVITTVEAIDSATVAFRSKYDALPGDFTAATTFWGTDTACPYVGDYAAPHSETCNGNGDDKIAAGATDPLDNVFVEMGRYWQHLSNAGLIAEQFTTALPAGSGVSKMYVIPGANALGMPSACGPKCTLALFFWDAYQTAANGQQFSDITTIVYNRHAYLIGINYGWYDAGIHPAFTAPDAYYIDKKIDDGRGRSGKVIASTVQAPAVTDHCQTAAGAYLTGDQIGSIEQPPWAWQYDWGCTIAIRASF